MAHPLLRLAIPAALLTLAACASTPGTKPEAVATLGPSSGSQVTGKASFRSSAEGIHLDVTVNGLTPGAHGFHIHEEGDCSAPDASSARGHFNPYTKPHGHPMEGDHHAGDMPNLIADSKGKASLSTDLHGITIVAIMGRAVVIHADPDDYQTQPAGNSGKRIACGVIKEN